MKNTYSISQGQSQFPALVRAAKDRGIATITKHNETVAYLVSSERWESMLETMELLANPAFQSQLQKVREGSVKYYPLETLAD